MKKVIISTILVLVMLGITGYFLYRMLMPGLVAEAIVSESVPAYIPKRLESRIESIKAPLNKGTEAMLETMHASDIPLERVLKAVDNVTEEEAYRFLEALNQARPADANEVFNLAKAHFPTDFDPEIFREPFNRHFNMKQINSAIAYANINRRSRDVDFATAREIVKKIIMEKEKELTGNGASVSRH